MVWPVRWSRTGTSTEKPVARGPALSGVLPSIEERGRGGEET